MGEAQNTNGQNSYFRNNPYSTDKSHWLTTETPLDGENMPMDSDGFRVYTLEYSQDDDGHTHLKMWTTKTYEETLDPVTTPNIEYPKEGMSNEMRDDFDATFNAQKKINVKLNLAIGGNLGGAGPYF